MLPISPDQEETTILEQLAEMKLTTGAIARLLSLDTDTVRNWVEKGVNHGGQVVKLKGMRIGKWWRTSEAWLKEFIESVNAEGMPVQQRQSKGEQSKDVERMRKALGS